MYHTFSTILSSSFRRSRSFECFEGSIVIYELCELLRHETGNRLVVKLDVDIRTFRR